MSNVLKPPCDEASIRSDAAIRPCANEVGPWVLAATILGSSMAFIDGSVVGVILPILQSELDATMSDLQWIVESYALLLAALILVGGALGDRFGRRRIFGLGVGLFALASAWCGVTATAGQLVAARAAQGFAGALLVPGSLAIISASFGDAQRGRAIGTWSPFTVARGDVRIPSPVHDAHRDGARCPECPGRVPAHRGPAVDIFAGAVRLTDSPRGTSRIRGRGARSSTRGR